MSANGGCGEGGSIGAELFFILVAAILLWGMFAFI